MKTLIKKASVMSALLCLIAVAASAQIKEVNGAASGPTAGTAVKTNEGFRDDYLKASAEYETGLKKLSEIYAADLARAKDENAKLKGLYTEGLISRRDMEASDAAVVDAQAKVDEGTAQMQQAKTAQAAALKTPLANDSAMTVAGGMHIWTTGDKNVDSLINYYGGKYGVDPYLVFCVMHQESRFGSGATSNRGAMGLMQLMPATAARYGVSSPYDVGQNIMGGTRYLKDLLAMFGGRVDLVLAGYNAGEGAVMKYGNRVPPYAETQAYVRTISYRYGQPMHVVQPTLKAVNSRPQVKDSKPKAPIISGPTEQPKA